MLGKEFGTPARRLASIFLHWLWCVGLLLAFSSSRAASPGEGEQLYLDYGCYQCHGYRAQGNYAFPPVPRLASKAYGLDVFSIFIRTPPDAMPAYAPSVLSDADVEAIFKFISSLEDPPLVIDIPELRNIE